MTKNIEDFKTNKELQNFIKTHREDNLKLEDALYRILDCSRLDVAKEIAADVLEEDLEEYSEEDVAELDFEDDDWQGLEEEEDE